MKKAIVILIIVIFIILSCIGGEMKMNFIDQSQRGVVFTNEEVKQHYCIQSSLALPIGVNTGLAFILFPRFFRALIRGPEQPWKFLLLRIWGFGLMILTIRSFWISCNFYFNLPPFIFH